MADGAEAEVGRRRERVPDDDVIEKLYVDAGRPSAAKLYALQRRAGYGFTRACVEAFVRRQVSAQRFAARTRDRGYIVGLTTHALYQADLIDMTRYSPDAKEALKWIYVAIRAFDRRLYAVPLATKSPGSTVFALRRVIDEAGGTPQVLMTDRGTE